MAEVRNTASCRWELATLKPQLLFDNFHGNLTIHRHTNVWGFVDFVRILRLWTQIKNCFDLIDKVKLKHTTVTLKVLLKLPSGV